ncbi:MAG: MFS transporter, partial [Parvularculaceae bacterium]|nr:MFS transporter [Parvularculaceae bacterium]
YAVSTIIGRILCGLALDRYPTHIVSGASMALPAFAFLLLASNIDATWAVALSMALFGAAQGAEGDLAGYLAAKYFPVRIYGTVLGLISAGMASSATTGSIILSATLGWDDSFTLFLLLLATAVSTGAVLLYSLRGWPAAAETTEEERPIIAPVFTDARGKTAAQAAE